MVNDAQLKSELLWRDAQARASIKMATAESRAIAIAYGESTNAAEQLHRSHKMAAAAHACVREN